MYIYIYIYIGLRRVTNKIYHELDMKKMQKILQAFNKGKYKYTKFKQFLNYCTHNKNEIKGSSRITIKAKRTK